MNIHEIVGYQKCLSDLQNYFVEIGRDGNYPSGTEVLNHFISLKLEELLEKLADYKGWDAFLIEDAILKLQSECK